MKTKILTLFIILTFMGCYLPFKRELTIHIQDRQDFWFRNTTHWHYRICYLDEFDTIIEQDLLPGQKVTRVGIKNDYNQPVLAFPVIENYSLPPLGGVYPYELMDPTNGVLSLTAEKGLVAMLFFDLREGGLDHVSVNYNRLVREIDERAAGRTWDLDYREILERLSLSDFSVYDIDFLETREVNLQPGPGLWARDKDFYTRFEVSGEEGSLTVTLPKGFNRFFNLNNAGVMEVYWEDADVIVRHVFPVLQGERSYRFNMKCLGKHIQGLDGPLNSVSAFNENF
ncbi:MAG: hypothetical protein JW969_21320 [Spirochaetales bacterium]|nr:hypothetical protein [Spirochaetales bacterium]